MAVAVSLVFTHVASLLPRLVAVVVVSSRTKLYDDVVDVKSLKQDDDVDDVK